MCKVDQSQPVVPLAHPKLLSLLGQLKGGRGLCVLGSIVRGRLATDWKLQKKVDRSLRRQRDENKVRGFTQVVMCDDVDAGLGSLLQTAGLGGLCPNTLMLGWSRHWRTEPDVRPLRMVRLIMQAHVYNMALIVCKGFEQVPDSHSRLVRPIDIWWVMHDGGLQLLLTTILRKARVWSHAALRVFCVVQADDEAAELHAKVTDFLYKIRIEASVKCVVLSEGALRHRIPPPACPSPAPPPPPSWPPTATSATAYCSAPARCPPAAVPQPCPPIHALDRL